MPPPKRAVAAPYEFLSGAQHGLRLLLRAAVAPSINRVRDPFDLRSFMSISTLDCWKLLIESRLLTKQQCQQCADRCSAGDAEHVGVGERVAQQHLHKRAGKCQ